MKEAIENGKNAARLRDRNEKWRNKKQEGQKEDWSNKRRKQCRKRGTRARNNGGKIVVKNTNKEMKAEGLIE
jgi:hypothetical protein